MKDNKRLVITILILLGIIILLFLCLKSCDFESEHPQAEQQKTLDFTELPEPEYIDIPATDLLAFEHGKTYQTVDFHNPETNKCYFQIRILLSDDTEIYCSDYIEPGAALTEIQLNQTLQRGIYENCSLVYDCYSVEDKHKQNGGQFNVTIYSD